MKLHIVCTICLKTLLSFLFCFYSLDAFSIIPDFGVVEKSPQAAPAIQPANAKFCTPGGWLYVSDVPNNADSFVWYRNGVLVGADNDSLFINNIGTFSFSCVLFNNKNRLDSISGQATVNQNPVAAFSFDPPGGCGKTKITFTDKSTPAGSIQSWSWDFGDPGSAGNTSNSQNPTHTFKPNPGTGNQSYLVKLTVKHDNGCVSTKDTIITIGRGPDPTLNGTGFEIRNNQPYFKVCSSTASTFKFTNGSTTSASNTNYIIRWGDGQVDYNSPTLSTVISHTYSVGIHYLTFIVASGPGCVDSSVYIIFVGNTPAGGLVSPGGTTICSGSPQAFIISGAASNPTGTEYEININDGTGLVTYFHPPPDTVYHTFPNSSCGNQSSTGQVTYPNSYGAYITIKNPCGQTGGSIVPIYVSGKPTADFSINPRDTACQFQTLTITKTGISGNNVENGNCTAGKIVWDIKSNSAGTPFVITSGVTGNDFGDPDASIWNEGSNQLFIRFDSVGIFRITQKVANSTLCGVDSITKVICINPVPQVSFTTNLDTICSGQELSAFGKTNQANCGNNKFKWTISYLSANGCSPSIASYTYVSGTDSTSASPKIQFSNPGFYTLSLQTFAPGLACFSAIVSKQIVVRAKPIVSISNVPNQICSTNQPVTPSGSASCFIDANSTYKWTFPNGTNPVTSSTQLNPGSVTFPNGSGSFSFSATNVCGTSTASQSITVTKLPVANISFPNGGAYCNNNTDSQRVTISGNAGGTFSSSPVGLIINPSTGAIMPTGSTVGSYTVTYTIPASGGCNAVTATSPVIITAATSGSISYSGNYCNTLNTSISVSYNNIGSGGAFSVTPSSGLNINLSTGAINPSQSTPGTYSIKYSIPASGGCSAYTTPSVSVTIYPKPDISGIDSVCKGSTVKLTALGSTPAGSNAWISANTSILSVDNSGLVTGNNSGTASIYYTDDKGCKVTFTVKVNSLPSITGPVDVCVGSQIKLIGTQLPASVNTWTSSDPTIATVTIGAAKDTGIVKGINSGAVTITYKNSSNCSITYTVNVRPVPTITGDTTSPVKCNDPSGNITISGLAANTTYTLYYNNGAPVSITSNASGQYVISGLKAGTYSNLYVMSSFSCKSNILSFTLVDPNPPATPLAGNDTIICSGNSVILTVTSNKPSIKYYWSGPGVAANTQGTSLTITNAQTSASGKYYVIADSVNCKSNPDSINLTVYPTPPVPTVIRQISYCQYEAASPLTATVASGSTLIWYNSNMVVLPSAPTPPTNSVGTYKYYVSQRNITDTCQSGKDSITVTIKPKPDIRGYVSNPTSCASTTGNIVIKGLSNGLDYAIFYDTSGVTVSKLYRAQGDSVILSGLRANTYSTIFAVLNGCNSDTIGPFSLIDPNPPLTPVSNNDTAVCSGNSVTFSINNPSPVIKYIWNGPGIPVNYQGTSITINTTNPGSSAGIYSVIADSASCKSKADSMTLTVYLTPAKPLVTSVVYYCQFDNASPLTAAASPGSTLLWYDSTMKLLSGAPTPPTGLVKTYKYFVSQRNITDTCQSQKELITVVVKPKPKITGYKVDPINCATATGKIILKGVTSGAYQVKYDTSGVAVIKNLTANGDSILIDALVAQTYSNIHVLLNGCPSDTIQSLILSDPFPPDTPKLNSNSPVCSGNSISVSVSNTVTGGIYAWSGPRGSLTGSTSGSVTINNATKADSGLYLVTVTLNNCKSPAGQINVIVNQTPPAPVITSPVYYCKNDNPVALTATTLDLKHFLRWYAASTGGVGSSIAPVPSTNTAGTTSFYVSQISSDSCEGPRAKIDVIVRAIPEVDDINKTVCSGEAVAISPSSTIIPADTRYYWYLPLVSNSDSLKDASADSSQIVFHDTLNNVSDFVQTATYTVYPVALYTNPTTCPGKPFKINITVNPSPKIRFSIPNDTICSGDATRQVILNSPTPGAVITWNSPAVTGITGNTPSGTNTIPVQTLVNTTVSPLVVKYEALAANSGGFSCPGTVSTYEITVAPKPQIQNHVVSICSGSSFLHDPYTSQPPNRVPMNTGYTWTISTNNSNITGQNDQSDTVSMISDTLVNISNIPQKIIYTVQPYSGSLLKCPGDPFTIEVIVNPAPVIPSLFDTICSEQSFDLRPGQSLPAIHTLPDTLLPAGTVFYWSAPVEPAFIRGLAAGNAQSSIFGTLFNDSYAPYTVKYRVLPVSGAQGLCRGDSFDVFITVNPLASISNSPLSQELCNNGNSQAITWTSFSAGATYSWKLVKSGSITGFTGNDSGSVLASMQLGNSLHYPDTLRYAVSSTANECAAPATNYDIIVNPDSKASFTYPRDTSCWPFDIIINNTSQFWSSDPSVPNDRFEWYAIDSNNVRTLIGNQRNFPGYLIPGPGQRITIRLVAFNKFGCLNDSITHTFHTKPKPEPIFSINPVNGCGPLLVSVTNQTMLKDSFDYSWNFGNGQGSLLSDPPPVLFYNDTIRFIDTTYFIELKAYNECVTVLDTVPVLVLSKPKARFLPSTSTACSNAQILLSNTSLGIGNRYEWHFSDTTSILYTDSNINVPRKYSSGTVAIFTDTLIAINQCGRDTAVYPVVVTPNTIKPNFVVTASTKVGCAPLTVQLINASKGGTRFIWHFGDPNDPDSLVTLKNTDTIYHRYDSAGTYSIKLNVINACTDSTDYDTARVLRTPNASFNYTTGDICVGQPVRFFNTTDVATNYSWDLGIPPVSNSINPVINYPQAGTYNIQLIAVLTDPTGLQCKDTAKGSVVIVDSLSGFFTTSADTGYCTPFTVTFTNQTPSIGVARWDFGDGTTGVGNIVSHTFDSAGTYKVHMMVTDPGGCKFGYFKNIVAGGPFGSLLYQPDTVCGDKPVRFEAAVNKVDSIRWDFGDGTVITTTAKIVFHVYKVPGIYIPSVELIAGPGANCRISVPGKDTIRVDYLGAGFSTSLTNYCDSTKLIVTDTSYSYSGIQQWSWTLGNGNTSSSQNVTAHYYSSGNYALRQIITSRYGCTDTADLTLPVKVNATPVASINAPNSGCENDTLSFIANVQSVDPIDSLKWQGSLTGYGNSLSAPFNVPGNYSVFLIAGTVFGCFDTAIHNFVINPLPEITVRENKTICLGQSAQLTAITNAASVTWAGTQWLSCSNCINPVATPPVTTRYVATAISAQGCKSYDAALINVKQPIEIKASGEDTICIGDQVTLSVSGAIRYQWYPSDSISCTTCANPIVRPSNTTTYMVVGFDSDNTSDLCFTDTQYVVVTVGHYPMIKLPADTLVQTGSHLKPVPEISYAAGSNFEPIRYYSWTPRALIDSFSDSSVPVIKALRNQCYQLEVENIYGCKSTDDYCIKVYCENTQVFIPNAFTPSQNTNNRFWVRTKGINKIKSFRVFNRWGEVVFEKNNYTPVDGIGVLNPPDDQGWDGRVRGVLANPDVYVYVVDVICENQVSFSYKGNVTLLR